MSTEDDDLQLSASTLEALKSFMSERDEQQRRFEELRGKAEDGHDKRIVTMTDFEEDWNQSQFWYDDATALSLAEELLEGATDQTVIGLVSAPSVYVKIQELKATGRISPNITVKLFEFDRRFEVFGEDFIPYDFQSPLRGLPAELKNKFDNVLVDPPFLSEDCQTKTALSVKWMTRSWDTTSESRGSKTRIMLCTGERVQALVERLYRQAGLKVTRFEVRHRKGLSNEFRCYSTFQSERIRFVDL